ncbi:MAG: hypothetical protein KAI33_05895 [Elusimicrobiales bacterium]|nr:hypothetical protein [Elusimicrobiales bacterium]
MKKLTILRQLGSLAAWQLDSNCAYALSRLRSFALISSCLILSFAIGANAQTTPQASSSTETIKISLKDIPSKEPISLSGIVLMPTAFRGNGADSIGLGLDFNAAYYIGRLYGENSYAWTNEKSNYIDRIGVWLLMSDAKMLVQSEKKYRPAMAAGVLGIMQFRDSPQPSLNQPTVSVQVDNKNTNTYAGAYVVLSKRIRNKFILNAGYSDGDFPKIIYQLSEFLSEEAMSLNGYSSFTAPSGMLFAGLAWMPKPGGSYIGIEMIVPQGATQNPKLFNLHLGTLLKLNFEISYLTFDGGYDLMGMFQFRYSYFPR